MYTLTFIDKYGNTVTNFTQWDTNQDLYIEASIFNKIPQFHFCNKNSEKALVVNAVTEGDLLKISVPNMLLIEPYPITIYAYISDIVESVKIGRTVEYVQLPVRPRPEPDSFVYENNVDIIDLQIITEEIVALNTEMRLSENLRVQAENQRIENEEIRQETLSQITESATQASEAATRANTAAQECEDFISNLGENTGFVPYTEKGQAGGVAILDDVGKVPLEQLPEDIGGGLPKVNGYIPFMDKVYDITLDSNVYGYLKIDLPLNDTNYIENDDEQYKISFDLSVIEHEGNRYYYTFSFDTIRNADSVCIKEYSSYVTTNSMNDDNYFCYSSEGNPFIALGEGWWRTCRITMTNLRYILVSGSRTEEESYKLLSDGWNFSVVTELPDGYHSSSLDYIYNWSQNAQNAQNSSKLNNISAEEYVTKTILNSLKQIQEMSYSKGSSFRYRDTQAHWYKIAETYDFSNLYTERFNLKMYFRNNLGIQYADIEAIPILDENGVVNYKFSVNKAVNTIDIESSVSYSHIPKLRIVTQDSSTQQINKYGNSVSVSKKYILEYYHDRVGSYENPIYDYDRDFRLEDCGHWKAYTQTNEIQSPDTTSDPAVLIEYDIPYNETSIPVKKDNIEPTDISSLWLDNTDISATKLKVYDEENSSWVEIVGDGGNSTLANSSPVSVTNIEPTDTKALWVDTTDMSAIKLKIYNSETSEWVSIN
ncbi:MAG: hypothetical protein PUC73_05445 [Lachnospiraceae bacterium]|nr:hypothetical protein [Lachnospiraceae bacterium]